LNWNPADFTGGAIILDYSIYITEIGGDFMVLAPSILNPTYTVTELVGGKTY
jgi:hypothetical protein